MYIRCTFSYVFDICVCVVLYKGPHRLLRQVEVLTHLLGRDSLSLEAGQATLYTDDGKAYRVALTVTAHPPA